MWFINIGVKIVLNAKKNFIYNQYIFQLRSGGYFHENNEIVVS